MLIKIIKWILNLINLIVIKNPRKIILIPFPNSEAGSISVANYIVNNYSNKDVYYVIEGDELNPIELLDKKVNLIIRRNKLDPSYLLHLFSSKYIFFTHGLIIDKFPKKQITINLWHGLLYKNIMKLLGKPEMLSDYVVGTSELSKVMFSKAFGVSKEQVTTTGYPRNDFLLKGKIEKENIINKLNLDFSPNKLLLWMPTYRKSIKGDIRLDGIDVDNPFCINNFDLYNFNMILKNHNAICLVKPHPMAEKNNIEEKLTNVVFIDDNWINDKKLNLYEFVGCTDLLISDVSSIIIDYMLLDNPIFCISEDFEEYKKTRGFYFEDIENKIPTEVLKNQKIFFEKLNQFLKTEIDPFEEKRIALKKEFFKYHDANSTKRLVELIFN